MQKVTAPPRFLLAAFFLSLLLFAGTAVPLQAQDASTAAVTGQVVDPSGEPLPGVNVIVLGTNRGTSTSEDGRFRIARVPEGEQEVRASFVGYQSQTKPISVPTDEPVQFVLEPTVIQGEEVTVYGELARGQAKALNDQRNAENIVNVASREKFGRYPDNNAAETVNRMPAVSITRDQGEGEFVQIRGMAAQYNSLMINGQRLPGMGTGAGRSVGLDLVQSNLIERIELTKALTPDMDADALGGTVNFELRDAGPEPTVFVKMGGGFNNQAGTLDRDIHGRSILNGFGLLSNRFMEGKLGVLISGSYNNTDRGSLFESNRYVNEQGDERRRRRVFDYDVNRERYGFIGNLGYEFNPANEVEFTFNYNRYKDDEIRRAAEYFLEEEFEFRETRNRTEDQELILTKLDGDHDLGFAELSYSGSWARSHEEIPDRTYIDASRTNPVLGELSPDEVENLSSRTTFEGVSEPLSLQQVEYKPRDTEENLFSGSADLSVPLGLRERSTLSLGGVIDARDREFFDFDTGAQVTDATPEDMRVFEDGEFAYPDVRFGSSVIDQLNLSRPLNVNMDPTDSEENYEASEQILAGYVMNTTDWTDQLQSVVGVRIEETTHDYSHLASSREGEGSYVSLFPSVHLTYRFSSNMQLRAAATRGLSRPNYTDLVPFRSTDDDAREISRGNPNLDPSFAQNYDLMFERYGPRLGFLSVGVFAKFFRDAIVTEGIRETIDGQEFIVFRPVNGGRADLFGFEIATTQSLSKLGSSSLRSFGIDANYTYNYSEADFGDRRDDFPLVRSPSHVANVGLTYDNAENGLTAVVSGTYRSFLFEKFEGGLPIWEGSQFHLGASASYDVTNSASISLTLNNLTNQPNEEIEYKPSEDRSRKHEQEWYSWWGTLSVSYSLF